MDGKLWRDENSLLTNNQKYVIINYQIKEVLMMLKSFWIYWGDNQVSCFRLRNRKQAESIAKQYKNVKKIEEKG
jgi:hypothetical protein